MATHAQQERDRKRRRAAEGLSRRRLSTPDPLRYATPEMRRVIWERDGKACRYCGAPVTLVTMNAEHVIPWKHGGPTDPTNLVAACAQCNRAKLNGMGVRPRHLGKQPSDPFKARKV